MIRRRRPTTDQPTRVVAVEPQPVQPDPRSADAWIGYFHWLAEAGRPQWLPSDRSMRAARTNALRRGDYRETPLTS